jgi:DNA replication protein DnaC
MRLFKYVCSLVTADIPTEYWQLYFEELNVDEKIKNLLRLFFSNYKNALVKHKGIMFAGINGVGKTALLCEIGKYFISEKISVKRFTFEQFTNAAFKNNSDFFESLSIADVLLFDEFGKGYVKADSTFLPGKIESFVKDAIENKVLCLATNFNQEELRDLLGDSIMSALERQVVTVVVDGSDYSNVRQGDWVKDLMSIYDYGHVNIRRYADKF